MFIDLKDHAHTLDLTLLILSKVRMGSPQKQKPNPTTPRQLEFKFKNYIAGEEIEAGHAIILDGGIAFRACNSDASVQTINKLNRKEPTMAKKKKKAVKAKRKKKAKKKKSRKKKK